LRKERTKLEDENRELSRELDAEKKRKVGAGGGGSADDKKLRDEIEKLKNDLTKEKAKTEEAVRQKNELEALQEKREQSESGVRYPFICGVVLVWCGVVWCGVVWCGVVWCGVIFG